METTFDGLLNRRVIIEQPKRGFRVAIDTVLLAAAVRAQAGEAVLDLGCGAGGGLLCLAARVPDLRLTGVEIQPELAELCRTNLAHNGYTGNVITGDATRPTLADERQARLTGTWFDHVLINPPYHDEARHDLSPVESKRIANAGDGNLLPWLQTAARALKPGGSLTIIHRADRGAELVRQIGQDFGLVETLLLAPKQGIVPKRLILRAIKGAAAAHRTHPDFILHEADGRYTAAAEALLRHAQPLAFGDIIMPQ